MQKKSNSNSLTAYKFCYTHDRDLFSFPVDQKLESINGTLKKICLELRVWFPKTVFFYTPCIHILACFDR